MACVVALVAAGACQSIAGISDRTLYPSSAACHSYCTRIMSDCTGKNTQYSSMYACLGTCNLFGPGEAGASSGNSLACRLGQLSLAESTNGENGDYCPSAGPSGGTACGTNCESYCALLHKACPTQFNALTTEPAVSTEQQRLSECESKCQAFPTVPGFDAQSDDSGDTLQCRLIQLSDAAADSSQCPSAQSSPTAPCVDPATKTPTCVDYCRVVMTACTGALQVYDNSSECQAVCAKLPKGNITDKLGENSIGCRTYHSYNAIIDAKTHCPHAGPGGAGVCDSSYCEAYCTLINAGCSNQPGFSAQYNGSAAGCLQKCNQGVPTDPNGYSIASTGDNVQCRIVHASKAIAAAGTSAVATDCAAAFGGAPCDASGADAGTGDAGP